MKLLVSLVESYRGYSQTLKSDAVKWQKFTKNDPCQLRFENVNVFP